MANVFLSKFSFSLCVLKCPYRLKSALSVNYSFSKYYSEMKGLVVGVYTESNKTHSEISSHTETYTEIDQKSNGRLSEFVKATGPFFKSSKNKILWVPTFKDPSSSLDFDCITVVDLGAKEPKVNVLEERDEKAENLRCSIADGINALRSTSNFDEIYLDPCDIPQCVGESAALTLFSYDELKQESSRKPKPKLNLYKYAKISNESVAAYEKGLTLGESQNFCRHLQETPSNYMTPTIFCSTVAEQLKNANVKVVIRDREWIESMKMGSFLSVAAGSHDEPKLLELHYDGAPDVEKCIALVGKGVTFDTGGISIKPSSNMHKMRGDMSGAAVVVSTMLAAASLGLKINVKAFTPLTDNMPDGKATKPGDVVTAMNGKTIMVDNTDAEGRLILCDALCYAQSFKPVAVLDVATLTGAVRIALGAAASAVYCNDDTLYEILHKAGEVTGDRVWRMPLFKHFAKPMTTCILADLINLGGPTGGSCTAAAFLQEFIEPGMKWCHADIAGVMEKEEYNAPYLCKGMSGRPTRTFIQFLESAIENFPELK